LSVISRAPPTRDLVLLRRGIRKRAAEQKSHGKTYAKARPARAGLRNDR
jgi:hypothetical protein